MRQAIFLSIDGLGTNLVGAYGNSICPTPNMNGLAANAVVLDQFWADSSNPLVALRSLWTGTHMLAKSSEKYSVWREQIGKGLLVTDDVRLAEDEIASQFERVLLVEHNEPDQNTEFERLIEAALGEWLDDNNDAPLVWIHSKGLRGTWDAPYEYRKVMCDEDDPAPPTETHPLSLITTEETDPDEVFRVACALGGQVVVIDQAIGELLATVRQVGYEADTLIGLIGLSGYPLGEHRQVGGESGNLYAESLHSPCILRLGASIPLGYRTGTLMQPHELGEWIEWWFQELSPELSAEQRILESLEEAIDSPTRVGAIISSAANETFVATPAWSCRFVNDPAFEGKGAIETVRTELFVKPDDRWEQNEVSDRAHHIVEKMHALRIKLTEAYSRGFEGEAVNWYDEELVRPNR